MSKKFLFLFCQDNLMFLKVYNLVNKSYTYILYVSVLYILLMITYYIFNKKVETKYLFMVNQSVWLPFKKK